MLRAILNKSWRQLPTKQQLYGHLPPITKTTKVRRTRRAEHCWRSRDELISDVLQWTPSHGREKAGWPAWTKEGVVREAQGYPCWHHDKMMISHSLIRINSATTWKKSSFVSSDRSDFHIIDNLSTLFLDFHKHMWISLSVVEILLSMSANWSTCSRVLPLWVERVVFYLKL